MRIQFASISGLFGAVFMASQAMAAPLPHSDFNGVWQVTDATAALRTLDGKEPPLLPQTKARYEQHRQAYKKGDKSFDPTLQCQPPGVPRLSYEAMPLEIMVQARQVVFMYQWNRLVRWVNLDKPHSEPLSPTFLGQSVGRWEQSTLVVDTNGFNDTTLLDSQGLPHSDELRVVERYTLDKSGNTLTAVITIEDPQTFSTPWQTRVSFKRRLDVKIEEDVCVERLELDQYK